MPECETTVCCPTTRFNITIKAKQSFPITSAMPLLAPSLDQWDYGLALLNQRL
ncbi:hypothetical protein SAMN05216516_103212 [Izhakiella capsodis]|uniref:Uncharacterized protein n=1 Tax=Izhakiella capsodis TaxID=1367852 RepID=A0A1I4X174_9GAMM|nr:hypothetical protein SAMN05216516_103212 [Izhakiella capsodis]